MTNQDDPPSPTCWSTPHSPSFSACSFCLGAGDKGGRSGRGLSWWLARLLVGVWFGRVLTVGVVDAGAGVWVLTSRSVVTSDLQYDVAGGGPTCVWERDVSRGEAARCLPSLIMVRARNLPPPPPQHRLQIGSLTLVRVPSGHPPFISVLLRVFFFPSMLLMFIFNSAVHSALTPSCHSSFYLLCYSLYQYTSSVTLSVSYDKAVINGE